MADAQSANAAAGPSSHRAPAASLAPVRARPDGSGGEDDAQGVVMLPAEPNVFTDKQLDEYKEQDRFLPIANVGRIMKNSLPDSAKIAKEAKECVQECVSEFISFLSSEAADKVLIDKRKTINGEDILHSMNILGFDNYEQVCRIYLAKYREYMKEHAARTSREGSPLQEADDDGEGEDADGQAKKPGKRSRKTGGGTEEGDDASGTKKRPKGA